ncbi:MAG TPA: hypothetical protein PK079_10600 [Leptospiraceae bacterium]|nr:hypothetical protein [Leptospiraceae bacterium]HMW05918.1 hypothetical protein [Leptospiraceae bacterium]HMY32717.1 hypothetical protein [Leptospiraceae bacterium]HMZ62525.1 hypothetical protein [Leptospiraceae bacterium]HNA05757.1 hypothetical protein [Leptospiraceae bacterium]
MNLKKTLIVLVLILSGLYACQKEKEDHSIRNLLLLGTIRNQSTTSSSSSCTSGMIVCIPKGIAE